MQAVIEAAFDVFMITMLSVATVTLVGLGALTIRFVVGAWID